VNRTKKIRLAYYCPGTGSGGPWRYLHSLLRYIDKDRFEVMVFCDQNGRYDPRPEIRLISIRGEDKQQSFTQGESAQNHQSVPMQPKSFVGLIPNPLKLLAGFTKETLRLSKLFQQQSIDIFHTQNTGCEESPVAAKLAGIPKVLGTFHVDSTYDLHNVRSGPSYRLLENMSNRSLDVAIGVSHATSRNWINRTRIGSDRVVTIHNGIDPDKFRRQQSREIARRKLGIPVDALILGGVGRLDEAKGFVDLIEAVRQMMPSYPNLYLVIAGSGPLKNQFEEQVQRSGLSDRILLLGFQSDVQQVLDALDLFVLSSWCEACPYAVLEAMASELPVIGTAVGGVPELIEDEVTGLIVPARSPRLLSNAINRLMKSQDTRDDFGRNGRERVKQLFLEKMMVEATLALYV
jgi:glycosyltransferase involved in cell wall biosynthesis